MDDREVFLAVAQSREIFLFEEASKKLRGSKEFLKEAVTHNISVLYSATTAALQADPDLLLIAIARSRVFARSELIRNDNRRRDVATQLKRDTAARLEFRETSVKAVLRGMMTVPLPTESNRNDNDINYLPLLNQGTETSIWMFRTV